MGIPEVNLVGIAIAELEKKSPRTADVDRPKILELTLQFVQPDAVQAAERFERCGSIELGKTAPRDPLIHARELGFAPLDELPSGRSENGTDHMNIIICEPYNRQARTMVSAASAGYRCR